MYGYLTIVNANISIIIYVICKFRWQFASVSTMYADDRVCSIMEAKLLFYASDTYKQLQREETKLWHFAM